MPDFPLGSPETALTWSGKKHMPRSQAISIALHASLIVVLLIPALQPFDLRPPAPRVRLVFPGSLDGLDAAMKKQAENSQGGGGSGNHMQQPAGAGRSAPFNWMPLAPARRNLDDAALQVPPAVAGSPETPILNARFLDFGDPFKKQQEDSQGPGKGGSYGDGDGNGLGDGIGDGVGPGNGWGVGGNNPRIGGRNGVGMPACAYCPNPTFTQEAIAVKYQGNVTLWVWVTADGKPGNIRLQRSAGLGLDERAMEAVRTWRFQPARDASGPVAAWVLVEVMFRQF